MINNRLDMIKSLFKDIVEREYELISILNDFSKDNYEETPYNTLEVSIDYDIYLEIEDYVTDIKNFSDITNNTIYAYDLFEETDDVNKIDIIYNLKE